MKSQFLAFLGLAVAATACGPKGDAAKLTEFNNAVALVKSLSDRSMTSSSSLFGSAFSTKNTLAANALTDQSKAYSDYYVDAVIRCNSTSDEAGKTEVSGEHCPFTAETHRSAINGTVFSTVDLSLVKDDAKAALDIHSLNEEIGADNAGRGISLRLKSKYTSKKFGAVTSNTSGAISLTVNGLEGQVITTVTMPKDTFLLRIVGSGATLKYFVNAREMNVGEFMGFASAIIPVSLVQSSRYAF